MGGNIAMNAGGLLRATYGVTREAVVGLEVVLADGSVMSLGHRAVKGVTGYELTALMIGSEATLAAVRVHAADDDTARLPETGSGGVGPHRCRSPLLRTQIVRPFRGWLTFDHG
ncbi:FAD-binding protein [Kaistella montana]|nr:FAD-binding protein [Kaistella montana]STY69536.1 Uncharacterized FAD-linked oxidoreductase Rv2280 [Micrococcus luteus]